MFTTVFNDIMLLFLFLLIGFALRELIKPLQRLFIPSSVLGGAVALILGPQCLGLITIPDTFKEMASPMICVVMTCMIFGTTISVSKLKAYAGATNVECCLYFGQMGIGLLTGWLLCKVFPTLPDHWGILSVYAFFGGHGTASTAGQFYESYGYEGMLDLGIILATLGLMLAMIGGMIVINIGVRKGWTGVVSMDASDSSLYGGVIPKEQQRPIGMGNVAGGSINSLALQLALIFVAMLIGDKIFDVVAVYIPICAQFPSFLHGMVGAAIIWAIMTRTHLDGYYDAKSCSTISGLALEICVTSAVATLNIGLMASYVVPIAIITVVIVAFTLLICFYFGHRWLDRDWFETMCIIYGQSTGSSTTGIALGRCVDPDGRTTAYDSFGVASSIFGPVASILVAVMPLVTLRSDWVVILIGIAIMAVNILVGELVLARHKKG